MEGKTLLAPGEVKVHSELGGFEEFVRERGGQSKRSQVVAEQIKQK